MDPIPPHPPPHEPSYVERAIHELRAPLTVLKGHVQLLARTLRRGGAPDGAAVLARHAVIERVVGELTARIRELEAAAQALPAEQDHDAPPGR